MIEERIAQAKQSSNLEARNIQRPNKKLDADVLIALAAANASMLPAMTAAGESGAVYVRDLIKRLQGYLANRKGISAYGVAHQVVSELILERCQHENETARCVAGAWVANGEWNGEPSGGWPDCPLCLGSGRAKVDRSRRAYSAGRENYTGEIERAYADALNWCAAQMMNEGREVWRLLK